MAGWQGTWVFKTEDALWTDTLAKNPDSWIAHSNLGNVLFRKGQVDEALKQFQKALEICPNYPEADINLGAAIFQKGQVDQAVVAQFQKAVEINPNYPQAYNGLGVPQPDFTTSGTLSGGS